MAESPHERSGPALTAVLFALATIIFGTTMPTPLYGQYKKSYGLADWSVTGIYAVYAAGIVLALVFLNGLSDWVGRRGALWAGLVVFALADAVFVGWSSELGLYAARIVSGIAAGIYVGTATVAAGEVASTAMKAHAPTYATAANVTGLGLGPIVAGVIVQDVPHSNIVVYVVHLGLVIIAALLLTAMPETHARRRAGGFVLPQMPRDHRREFMGASLIGLGGLAAFGLLAGLTQAFLKNIAGVNSPLMTGLAVGVAFVVSGLTQVLLRDVGSRAGLTAGCGAIVAGLAAIVAAIPLGWVWLYFVGAALCGVGQGLTMARAVGVVVRHADPDRRMSVMNLFFTLVYLGAGIPIVALGVAVTYGDFLTSALVFAAVVAAITLAGLGLSREDARP